MALREVLHARAFALGYPVPEDPQYEGVGKDGFPKVENVKIVKHMAEDGRVAVRNLRRDARKHLESAEKAGDISADDLERAEKELEKITHDHVEQIDKALGRKEQELLEV